MSKRIKIIDNSGIRFPKKQNPGQSDLSAFGYDASTGTYYNLPVDIGAKNSQITPANITTNSEALNIITNSISNDGDNHGFLHATLISDGGSTITEIGAVWNNSGNPSITNSADTVVDYTDLVTPGTPFIVTLGSPGTILNEGELTYVRAFATGSQVISGQTVTEIVYGGQVSFTPFFCLIKGTLITLSDFTHKKIEDITYDDELLVWNFDEGKFDSSKPLWIASPSTAYKYSLTKFSDGSELSAILPHLGHRILNIEKETFTYTMIDDAPVRKTTTFNEKSENVILLSKEIIEKKANFYNIITDSHINMFANGLLTSCRLNNFYPIRNMKFVKDDRKLRTIDEYENVSEWVFNGLRLADQNMPIEDLNKYIRQRKIEEVYHEYTIS